MKFSFQWLSQLVKHGLSPEELTERLTMAGLEVTAVMPVAAPCSKVVLARVKSVKPHPDAARLKVCEVDDGEGLKQVVCGAPNVRAGMYAPLAQIGASLGPAANNNGGSGDRVEKFLKIRKAKLRGVESQGMLCSAEELGLEEKSDGLLELDTERFYGGKVSLGEDLREVLALDDVSIELDLTPNRGDCLGMRGLAREVGVLSRTDPCYPKVPKVKESLEESFPVHISAPDACPRYLGRVVRDVDLGATTPLWLQERLRRSGLRSIDPVVDVTNYILLEYGQPLHAFDLDKLQGGIQVRMAKQQEPITLLDGKELELRDDTLIIADAKQAVAVAGIMGGAATAVGRDTAHVMLECALFTPLAVAGRARSYGLHTDACQRYERGVDPAIQHQAITAATALLQQIAGGAAGPVTEAGGEPPAERNVLLRPDNVARLLGIPLPPQEINDVLTRLGFKTGVAADGLQVQVPGFRYDVAIEADLIEELARIYGYNNLPSSRGMLPQQMGAVPETHVPSWRLRRQVAALGYQEVMSYSFIDPAWHALVCGDDAPQPVTLENPLSTEMSVMRDSILPGLLQVLTYNSKRQHERLRIFEVGMVFRHAKDGKSDVKMDTKTASGSAYIQQDCIAGLVCGSRYPKNWSHADEMADFYDIKGDVEALLGGARRGPLIFNSTALMPFHPGQCAAVSIAGNGDDSKERFVGHVGALHPAIGREIGVSAPVFLFEFDLQTVREVSLPRAQPLSRYPAVSRDLAVVLDEGVAAADLMRELSVIAGEHLRHLRIFDVYRGPAAGAGKKSVALGLTWQHPSRTLDDEEINAIMHDCVKTLQGEFGGTLR